MKLYRYMSISEFIKMSLGEEIKPYEYEFENAVTGSKGLCFLGEETLIETEEYREIFTPMECLRFLSGIVNSEVLVEFETQNTENIQTSWGRYSDPFSDDCDSFIFITEYCVMSYQKDSLVPTRYAFPNFSSETKYIEYEDEKINIMEMIEHAYSDDLLRFSLLPQIKGKAFWLDADYAEPGIGEKRTNAEWRKKRLIYGDLMTRQEQCSIDMVLDSVELLHEMGEGMETRPLVRFVLNGEYPSNWENLINDFMHIIDKDSKDGTFYKDSSERMFEDFCRFVALCTAYPGLEKYYKLYVEKSSISPTYYESGSLDMIRKDFDIDKVESEYLNMTKDMNYRCWQISHICTPFLKSKLEERIRKNSIGVMTIKKIDGEYLLLVEKGIMPVREDEKDEFNEGMEKFCYTIKNVGDITVIKDWQDQRLMTLDYEPYRGSEWLTLGEKYKRCVKREKKIEEVEKKMEKELGQERDEL